MLPKSALKLGSSAVTDLGDAKDVRPLFGDKFLVILCSLLSKN